MVDNIIQCALFSQTYKNLEKVVPHHQQNKACFFRTLCKPNGKHTMQTLSYVNLQTFTQ